MQENTETRPLTAIQKAEFNQTETISAIWVIAWMVVMGGIAVVLGVYLCQA